MNSNLPVIFDYLAIGTITLVHKISPTIFIGLLRLFLHPVTKLITGKIQFQKPLNNFLLRLHNNLIW